MRRRSLPGAREMIAPATGRRRGPTAARRGAIEQLHAPARSLLHFGRPSTSARACCTSPGASAIGRARSSVSASSGAALPHQIQAEVRVGTAPARRRARARDGNAIRRRAVRSAAKASGRTDCGLAHRADRRAAPCAQTLGLVGTSRARQQLHGFAVGPAAVRVGAQRRGEHVGRALQLSGRMALRTCSSVGERGTRS